MSALSKDAFAEKVQDWDNAARRHMVDQFVERVRSLNALTPDSTLLEIGSGTGLVALSFENEVRHLWMIDTSEAMIEALGKKVEVSTGTARKRVVHGDLTHLNPTVKADVVLLFMTLHHIDPLDTFFVQLRSHMTEGARVVIGDLYREDGSFHAGEQVPHPGFDPEELRLLLGRYGFAEVQIDPLTTVKRHGREYPLFILSAKAV